MDFAFDYHGYKLLAINETKFGETEISSIIVQVYVEEADECGDVAVFRVLDDVDDGEALMAVMNAIDANRTTDGHFIGGDFSIKCIASVICVCKA